MGRHRFISCTNRLSGIAACCAFLFVCLTSAPANAQSLKLKIQQITSGPKHHFFGYIGTSGTLPGIHAILLGQNT